MEINKKKHISPNDQWTADEFCGMPYRRLGNSGLRVAKAWGLPLNQLVIAYMLAIPGMGPVIPSVSSVDQLASNARGGRITFSREEMRAIKEILAAK